DDAERLPEGHVDAARDRDRRAVVLVDRTRVEVEDLGDHADLAARTADRLADVARLDPRELLRVLLHQCREAAEQPRARRRRDRTPRGERGPRARDSGVGVLDARPRKLGKRLLRRRIEDGDRGHRRTLKPWARRADHETVGSAAAYDPRVIE